MQKMESQRFSGYRVAAGCGIVIFFHLGCCYIWAAMIPYFLEHFGCSLTLLSASSALGTLIGFLASFTAGTMLHRLHPRRLLITGTAICAVFMLINAFASAPWMLYVSNGISGFILAWGAQVTCASVINRWFIDKRNTVIGVVFGCSAFGGALFMFLAGNLIGTLGQRNMYLLLGAIAVGGALFSELFLIRDDPEQLGQRALGADKGEQAETVNRRDSDGEDLTPAEARKSRSFFLMIAATFFGSMLLATFSSFATTFWTSNGVSQAHASTYASAMTLLGGLVSILVGGVADRWGIKTFITVIFGMFAIGVSMAILWGTVLPAAFVLVLNIIFISAGTPIQNISSSVTLPVFGPKAADGINGTLMAFFYAGSALSVVAFSALFDLLGSFIPVFVLVLVLAAAAFSLMMLAIRWAPARQRRL